MKGNVIAVLVGLALCVAAGGVSAVALAGGNPHGGPPGQTEPPGQGECEHGNSGQECKPDPQPDHGQECDEHGNYGGVNEDHCLDETEPTTPDPTTPDPTTPDPTTPDPTVPDPTTPDPTVPDETTPTDTTTTPEQPRGCPDGGPGNAGKDGNVPASGNTNDECDRSVKPPTVVETGGAHAPLATTAPAVTAVVVTSSTKPVTVKPKHPTPKPDDPPVVVKVEKKANGVVRLTTSDGKVHTGVMGSG